MDPKTWMRRRYVALGALLAVSAVVLAVVAWPMPAAAQWGSTTVTPETGAWCGYTDDGGSVRFSVSADGRWVRDIEVRTYAGSASLGELDRHEAQIKSSKFIFRGSRSVCEDSRNVGPAPRQPGGPGRCVVAPCRPISAPPGGSRTTCRGVQTTVRGTFETPFSASGTFTLAEQRSNNSLRKVTGQFTAWPASQGGCP